MPEYPDITIYIERLNVFIRGRTVEQVRVNSPFFLRTVDPPIDTIAGKKIIKVHRIGKQVVFVFPNELYLVLHLMIAGRLHWRSAMAALNRKTGLAALDFSHGSLVITEAGSKKRAALHLVQGENIKRFERGGMNVLEANLEEFTHQLTRENHTLKRTLTDPRLFDGIGNSYSDEILHQAKLSPVQLSQNLSADDIRRLYESYRAQLRLWTDRLREEVGDGFLEKVTAFRPDMAVHGKFNQPCPECATRIQRIRYAERETNYCPRCQTGGKLLSDRSLARLLKQDWPKTVEELEQRQSSRTGVEH